MNVFRTASTTLVALALSAAPLAAKPGHGPSATARLFDPGGRDAGYAAVIVRKDKAVLRLSLTGMTPGAHGLHFHTTGKCKGDGFASAGGHLNPMGKMHGDLNPAGSHLGDLPNVTADVNGVTIAQIPLKGSAKALLAAIFDADGTAIVVHAGPDDYLTDPTGNSGGRIACGVLQAK